MTLINPSPIQKFYAYLDNSHASNLRPMCFRPFTCK